MHHGRSFRAPGGIWPGCGFHLVTESAAGNKRHFAQQRCDGMRGMDFGMQLRPVAAPGKIRRASTGERAGPSRIACIAEPRAPPKACRPSQGPSNGRFVPSPGGARKLEVCLAGRVCVHRLLRLRSCRPPSKPKSAFPQSSRPGLVQASPGLPLNASRLASCEAELFSSKGASPLSSLARAAFIANSLKIKELDSSSMKFNTSEQPMAALTR